MDVIFQRSIDMKRINLLYDNLLLRLNELTIDGSGFNTYYDSLPTEKQSIIIGLAESLLNERRKIKECQVNKIFFTDYSDLIGYLDYYKDEFGDFPGFRENEIYGLINIIQKITTELGESGIDLDEELNVNVFELCELSIKIAPENYYYFDDTNTENSIILININKKALFKEFIDGIGEGTDVLFHLLNFIGVESNTISSEKHVLVKNGFKEKPRLVWSCLCLHILSKGGIVHESIEYSTTPSITSECNIELGKNFHQFADSIDILSEYNNQSDILDKYLRIYHVMENFMYKRPIVSLEKDSNGLPFSIRDFKRMYDKVSDSELTTLKSLCEEIMLLDFNSSKKFSEKILDDWKSLTTTHGADEIKINKFLKILNVHTNKGNDYLFTNIDSSNLGGFFGKLVYAFRNTMVHNRETEFHLTHNSLLNHDIVSDIPRVILEKFMIPNLEEIIFNLIIKENGIVWYNNSTLTLWESE